MFDFSLSEVLIAGIVAYILYSIFRGYSDSGKRWVCKACGYVGDAKVVVRGSLAIEVILWLCFIIPGLIYTVWRRGSEFNSCPLCGGNQMIPADSPIGKKIIDENAAH